MQQYNSGQCWKQITISYNGKSHGAQIVDEVSFFERELTYVLTNHVSAPDAPTAPSTSPLRSSTTSPGPALTVPAPTPACSTAPGTTAQVALLRGRHPLPPAGPTASTRTATAASALTLQVASWPTVPPSRCTQISSHRRRGSHTTDVVFIATTATALALRTGSSTAERPLSSLPVPIIASTLAPVSSSVLRGDESHSLCRRSCHRRHQDEDLAVLLRPRRADLVLHRRQAHFPREPG